MTRNFFFSARKLWSCHVAILMIWLSFMSGCTPTPKVVESWKDPSVTGPFHFKKILVIAVHPDAQTRRAAEDELVRQIGPDRAIHGDQVLTDADRRDPEKLKAKVKQSGVDGVVVVSIEGTTTQTGSSPDFDAYSYDSMWHNYDRDMTSADPLDNGSYSRRVILIRTRIFSVADEKLVWQGVSNSIDPKDAQSLIGDVAKAVGKRLREEHLID